MSMPDDRMRISNDEREAVAVQLREALDAGRLHLHEFDERTRALYEAQTYGEVERLLEDLPAAHLPERPAPPAAPKQSPLQRKASNHVGHVALGMGVLSFASFMPFTILAVVFGVIGLDNYKKGKADSRGFALAGLILGAVSVPVWIAFFLVAAMLWW